MPAQLPPALMTTRGARVLVVGTTIASIRMVRKALQAHTPFHVSGSREPRVALEHMQSDRFDVVVFDHGIGCEEAKAMVEAARSAAPIAFVVVGAPAGDACLLTGGDRIAVFGHDDVRDGCGLVESVVEAAERARAIRRRETKTRWLEREATTDGLTGLHNRRAFDEALNVACSPGAGSSVGLILMNVVGTGMVNHNYGLDEGDRMLQRAALGIGRSIRAADFAARLGADEFAVIIGDADIDLCRRVARRISRELEHLNTSEWPDDLPVSVTFGLACARGCASGELYEAAREQLARQRRFVPALVSRRGGGDDGPSVA
jgi:diguanylate cyclase (GGDEF)-like protein